jgi:YVTN family beta-propeller protein
MNIRASYVVGGLLSMLSAVLITSALMSLNVSAQSKVFVLSGSSKSSTIAVSEDDKLVAMVNPEDDSVSLLNTQFNTVRAKVKTGAEPSAVVFHPDNQTLFVANRADATVVKVTAANTNVPKLGSPVAVGSEPTGLALSPTGALLYVAEFAQGRVSVIDTATMKVLHSINIANPRAVSVTNDGNNDDSDETVVVPEFYGRPVPGKEASDDGRIGMVHLLRATDLSEQDSIKFLPIDSGFVPDATDAGTVKTSPNQLYNLAIQNGKLYTTSISASPKGPPRFNGNVQPVVYVGNLATASEDRGKAGSVNLAQLVSEALPAGKTRFFLADMVDIAFIGSSNVAYSVHRGADVVQRVVFDSVRGTSIGSQFNSQIDIGTLNNKAACQNPTGIATAHNAPRAYVNCWVSRKIAIIDLAKQALDELVDSTEPAVGTANTINRGRRFYFTGRGRWSKEAWSSCGSCHPDGLSDNITWQFGAGPRQTTSMDGSFSHGPGQQKQRIFNWTGIFDEMHDFERNTRDVSAGLGAVTTGDCGTPFEETPLTLAGGLDKPVREVQDTTKISCTKDWDEIEAFAKSIRPPRGLRDLDSASVARGAVLFAMPANANNGGCVACHGGAGWTVSRLSFTPSAVLNEELSKAVFRAPVPPFAATWNFATLQLQNQPPITDTSSGPVEAQAVGPKQVSCVIRNVGTFGIPGEDSATNALEKKPDGTRAQGRGGYNVPSLYGLSLAAPYLHHGQAQNLTELFDDPKWEQHLRAANPVFLTTGNASQQKRDLINFLLSIDATTPELALPSGFDACPNR